MMKIKSVIPVAGAGTRLRPHTYTQPKPLIPVAGKPIIAFIIEDLIAAGIEEFIFIIGYLGEKIKNYIEQTYPNIKKQFVFQENREGIGHAIWTARSVLSPFDEILIVLGDIIFEAPLTQILQTPYSCLGVKRVNDPREFGIVEYGEDGFVNSVSEKPKIPKSDMALVGIYKIKEVGVLMDALQYNVLNGIRTYDEFQLTDALMHMIRRKVKFATFNINIWFDCGKKEILLETNALLLDRKGYPSNDLSVFENTIIIHPVSIGENCTISNAIIGPHVTIGNNTVINYSIVKESIIGSYTSLEEVVLHHSVIGSDTAVKGLRQSLNIGDNTEIDFR